jgi:hypothetical protein
MQSLPATIEKQLITEIIDSMITTDWGETVAFYIIRHGIYWATCDRNTLRATHGHGRFTYNK